LKSIRFAPFCSFIFPQTLLDIVFLAHRDASYATQPLELLNDLGFQHSNMRKHLGDSKNDGDDGAVNAPVHDSVKSRKVDDQQDATISHVDHNSDGGSLQNSGTEG